MQAKKLKLKGLFYLINKVLEFVQQDGLLTEVVYLALKEMKQDPTLSPSEAIQFGYSEWCK